ncbi:MAG: hypothetical protein GWN31_13315, partial [Candidatus Thorarchaeota archaeon]|nr:hypothetical protein [Candidatus Thorarchaeota archaeon]NIW14873.1 hypothetical protein [Candidatus Thorarchaeota archaeon]
MATAKQLEYLTQLTGEDWLSIVGVKYPRLTRNKADWLIRSVKNIRLGHITDVGVVNSVVYFIKNWFPSFSF